MKNKMKGCLSDLSLWSLLLANIVTIYFALNEGWNLSTLIWIYWIQSIIIGLFNFIKILRSDVKLRSLVALLFLFHYSIPHFVYFGFLIIGTLFKTYGDYLSTSEIKYIIILSLMFFLNHLFSYFYNIKRENRKHKISFLMLSPYLRIIPMHIVIIAGYIHGGSLILFLFLKTFADIFMHIIQKKYTN